MEEDVLTKEEVMRRLREGTPVERLKGIANVLGENVIGGYIEDYESPGEKLGAGIDAYAQALFKNPVETIKGTATNFADTIKAVATPSYDETGMPVVTRDQALQALNLAGGAGATGAVASGTRLADFGKLNPAVVNMVGGRGPRDNLPVEKLADYHNAIRDAKDAVLQVEGFRRQMGDPMFDPMAVAEKSLRAKEEAARLLSNSRGGVSLTNRNTEAIITPSTVYPGKYRISYIDRRSREPMGDTEGFDTMEAAIKDAMDQGYVTLERFDPQNFANGGEVSREELEALANVEYAADMQKHLHDPLSQLGFDPDVAVVDRNPTSMYPTDSYESRGDVLTIDPGYGMYMPEIQAHEYRHRGAHKVLDLYRSDPERFTAQFGEAAANTAKNLISGDDYLYGETLAEFYEQPSKFNYPTVYYSETGDVVHPNRVEEYMAANPDVALQKVNRSHDGHLTHLQDFPETTDFREYKESGIVNTPELRKMFEGAEGMQRAAEFILSLRKSRGYARGGPVGVGSLNEIARGMFR